ncbi:MAG TPA: hypothetical protein VEB18_00785 [Candidatus Paceibacterota bacterium]|nr:hypothetical protein [Candidatus Paceibacterota bacterium]
MKSLIFGIVLILLIGIGGFFYRTVSEQSPTVACTEEAKICPDGTSVGRIPPSCEFAECPVTNRVSVAEAGLSFVVPAGYHADENAYGADPTVLAAFVKPSLSGTPQHTIIIRRYTVPDGVPGEDIILENTRYQPADMQATDFSRFESVVTNGREYRATVIERFEAQVHSAYYWLGAFQVLRFEIIEHDVVDWTDPNLVVADLPEHQALLDLLASVELR